MRPMWNKRDILSILGLALAYWASARLGLYLSHFGPMILLWPPAGISLFVLIMFGYRLWPGVALGALFMALDVGNPPAVVIGIIAGSTLQALFGAWLLNHTRFDHKIDHPHDVWLLVALGAGVAPVLGALIGVVGQMLSGTVQLDAAPSAAAYWWMTNALSNLIFAPFLFAFANNEGRSSFGLRQRLSEAGILTLLVEVGCLIVFLGWSPMKANIHPRAFILLPFAVWAAIRFQQRGAVVLTVLVAGFAFWGLSNGLMSYLDGDMQTAFVDYWLYMTTLATTGLFIAATYSGRLKSERVLSDTEAKYRELVESAQAIIWQGTPEQRFTYVSHEAEALLGYELTEWTTSPDFWSDHMHTDDRKWLVGYSIAQVANLKEHSLEYRMLAKDGHEVWLQDSVRVVADKDGKPDHLMGIMLDITARRGAEERLRMAQQAFEHTTEGILITDAHLQVLEVNQGFVQISGYQRDEILGRDPKVLRAKRRDDEKDYLEIARIVKEKGQWAGEVWGRHKNGKTLPLWLSASVIEDEDGEVINYVAVFTDITQRKQAEQQLQFLANNDALTGLPNRVLLQERIINALNRAKRSIKYPHIAILFIDIDRFKVVNDTLGHSAGDLLLQEVAKRLVACLRNTDTVARQGGDEFVVLLEQFSDAQTLSVVARKIMDALAKPPVFLPDNEVFISVSIGISVSPHDGNDLHSLMKNADAAMYRVKEQGKNNFQFYAADMNLHSFERLALETSLRRALERDELALYYQPKVDLKTGRIAGAEALLRWKHPDLGLILPLQFIALAEETGLIVPIGGWSLGEVCRQNMAWQKAGLVPISIAVNLSSRQFDDNKLYDTVTGALTSSGLDPIWLELEITESLVMRNADYSFDVLQRIRDMGVHVSIDDFGTGYSSLSYLKRFPVDSLKVDRSFIRDVPQDADDVAITQAIIAMAHSLGLKVIAEGVETEEQLDFLRELKCDQVQGYIFSEPIPEDEFAALLRSDMAKSLH